eukprot:TRINITY_DN20287_c2_g1_i1.p1 TRINITY_DN20287_c2_g1~~TRINITY_DN20287_c2_g1_i1.p1  ORF type:complete len:1012 (-),score=255.36 TRINITY_DN20287_c2_g1_i1:249-3284(-)
MAMRFMAGLNSIIQSMGDPKALKTTVETLGFQHLDLEVTVPRVIVFRDAIVDLLSMELGERFTSKAKSGWNSILNYVGGAYIYIRSKYTIRIKILKSSWQVANNKAKDLFSEKDTKDAGGAAEEGEGEEGGEGGEGKAKAETNDAEAEEGNNEKGAGNEEGGAKKKNNGAMQVPTTYNEMFLFNAAVMGFSSSSEWFEEILESFDTIVENVANSYRLQEECDTLSLRLQKVKSTINLPEYRSVMLASLRSLVPKDWDSQHEVAWNWLWENVERMLKALIGKPIVWEKSLERLILSFTEDNLNYVRREVYARFFALAPSGQDYFKQSTTRLYWIADRVVEMTLEMYRDPRKMVEDISALGLRHVGYGIPTEFFAPFVSGACEVLQSMNVEPDAEEGFRWSLSLVAKILVRTISEGSTIVMKAINTNRAKELKKAISCAPRGNRSMWMLNVTVGTQSISPLFWAIESGSLQVAGAMIVDLLVIRADRDNYYYGCDDLFARHPDVIKVLVDEAEVLLPPLFDGLIWRSRQTNDGQRRVNYYIKHLVVDDRGDFSSNLECIVNAKDPKLVCHPVVILFSDLLWDGIASRIFLMGRAWFLTTLCIFILSQSILQHILMDKTETAEKDDSWDSDIEVLRIVIFACRVIVYIGSMGDLIRIQVQSLYQDIRNQRFVQIEGTPLKVPGYLLGWKNSVSLCLVILLLVMFSQEPIFYCLDEDTEAEMTKVKNTWFSQNCEAAASHIKAYSTVSMLAMLLYWVLLIDLTLVSTRVSAFVLACGLVIAELGLYLFALTFSIATFASSISALNHNVKDFAGIQKGALSLTGIALGMYNTDHYEEVQKHSFMLMALSIFVIITVIFLVNLLIAQLNGSYAAVYEDMVGYARLNRSKVVTEMMQGASQTKWNRFINDLAFDEKLEFNEGDIGLAGGVQVLEAANENPQTVDNIRRFGGSTSVTMQWPEELEGDADDDENKFERLEKMVQRTAKLISEASGGKKKKNATGGDSQSSGGGGGSDGSL